MKGYYGDLTCLPQVCTDCYGQDKLCNYMIQSCGFNYCETPKVGCNEPCKSSEQCPEGAACITTDLGQICAPTACVPCLEQNKTCYVDGQSCQAAQCADGSGGTAGSSGGACSGEGDCGSQAVCVEVGGVNQCVAFCTGSCATCCLTTSTGVQVCAPSSSYCGTGGTTGGGNCGTWSASACSTVVNSTNTICKDYYAIVNNCGTQLVCHVAKENGKNSCIYPSAGSGSSACDIWSEGVGAHVTCILGSAPFECEEAIGCGL